MTKSTKSEQGKGNKGNKPVVKPSEKGKGNKGNTAPKSKPMPNGQSVHADQPVREPNWTPRRVAVVKAMRQLGATSEDKAVTADAIAAKAAKLGAPELKDRVDFVKIILDVYRTSELLHNGFAKSTRVEGVRGLSYYLTGKGVKTTFPVPDKKEEE
jgi:hypothetical protein